MRRRFCIALLGTLFSAALMFSCYVAGYAASLEERFSAKSLDLVSRIEEHYRLAGKLASDSSEDVCAPAVVALRELAKSDREYLGRVMRLRREVSLLTVARQVVFRTYSVSRDVPPEKFRLSLEVDSWLRSDDD